MAIQIQVRRGAASLWTSTNPTLAEGEIGYETDTKRAKIGDGATAWNSLAYFPANILASGIAITPSGSISSTDVAAAIAELDSEKQSTAFTPSGDISATTIVTAIQELDTEKVAKTLSPTGGQVTGSFSGGLQVADTHGQTGTTTHHARSHDHSNALDGTVAASAITFAPTGGVASTTVQTAIAELDTKKITNAFTPSGNIAATTLSGAIVELDSEKLATTASFGGQVTGTYGAITVANSHGASGVLTHHAQSHAHDGVDGSGTVAHSALTGFATDTAATDIHHTLGTGANQAAAGNHSHTFSGYMPVLYTTSDQSIASSTVLATVTAFNTTVAASAIVAYDYWLPIIAGAGAFKIGWTLPAGGATITWAVADSTAGSTVTTGTAVTVASSTAVQFVRVRAYYVGGSQSGTVSFQFAQNASSTTATVLKKGAWLTSINQ